MFYQYILYGYNILNWKAGKVCRHPLHILLERVTLMSTYEEFMVILTVALLIVAILNYRK